MANFEFKTLITDGTEHYEILAQEKTELPHMTFKSAAFPSSLISFLYFDIDRIAPLFKNAADNLWSLMTTEEIMPTEAKKYAGEAKASLAALAPMHVYFEYVFLYWSGCIDLALNMNFYTDNLLHRSELRSMPANLKFIQEQIADLFAHVLDADTEKTAIPQKMAAYYKQAGERAFQFCPQPIGYELYNREVFAEVFYPKSIYDLIDYHLRECVKREIKMRVCKNCKRWFAVTGHGATEYCDRMADSKGRTCKQIGAVTKWANKQKTNNVFTTYRREYKKRFARIRTGRLGADDFYAWSEEARQKKAECEAGAISQDEFLEWLKK